jgi:hypothetical protein
MLFSCSRFAGKLAVGLLGGVMTTGAVLDYYRPIRPVKDPCHPSPDLDAVLATIHYKATRETLTYDHLKCVRFKCDELRDLFEYAEEMQTALARDTPEDPVLSLPTTSRVVREECSGLAKQLCRRAMIRNGFHAQWAKAFVQDSAEWWIPEWLRFDEPRW